MMRASGTGLLEHARQMQKSSCAPVHKRLDALAETPVYLNLQDESEAKSGRTGIPGRMKIFAQQEIFPLRTSRAFLCELRG